MPLRFFTGVFPPRQTKTLGIRVCGFACVAGTETIRSGYV